MSVSQADLKAQVKEHWMRIFYLEKNRADKPQRDRRCIPASHQLVLIPTTQRQTDSNVKPTCSIEPSNTKDGDVVLKQRRRCWTETITSPHHKAYDSIPHHHRSLCLYLYNVSISTPYISGPSS